MLAAHTRVVHAAEPLAARRSQTCANAAHVGRAFRRAGNKHLPKFLFSEPLQPAEASLHRAHRTPLLGPSPARARVRGGGGAMYRPASAAVEGEYGGFVTGGKYDDASSLTSALENFGFSGDAMLAAQQQQQQQHYNAAMGYGMPPMSPRAAGQDAYNAQSAAELFSADPAAARWLAGAYGGSFDPERLLATEQQLAEHARPPMSPSYHRRVRGGRRAPTLSHRGDVRAQRLAPHCPPRRAPH
jgi:hypothetical protein